jgi:hypothetical protein
VVLESEEGFVRRTYDAGMQPDEPRRHDTTVVAIGASNLSRGLASLAATVRSRAGHPLDLFVAAGHGRSYGANSRVWMRRLPSILWSGLWRALDRTAGEVGRESATRRSFAVVTDIGNDLLYGFSVEQVTAWVDACLTRLGDRGFRTVVTRLPLASIERVGPLRYRALRTLYVPGCTLPLDALKTAAAELDDRVTAVARARGAHVIMQPGDWYGLDAIHVRRRVLPEVWSQTADAWGLPKAVIPPRASLPEWASVGLASAEVRSIAGLPRFTSQPAVMLAGRYRWWLY